MMMIGSVGMLRAPSLVNICYALGSGRRSSPQSRTPFPRLQHSRLHHNYSKVHTLAAAMS
jgi:hypothetical protein